MILSTIGQVIGVAVTTAALSLSGNAVAMTSPVTGTDAHCISARHHTHSAQAKGCRENGWVIRPRIVVGPYGHVRFNRMPPCRYEDGTYPSASPRHNHIGMQRHCFWNAQERGNGRGDSFYIDHPGSPHWYTTDITWVL
jgi:hypothetical protein